MLRAKVPLIVTGSVSAETVLRGYGGGGIGEHGRSPPKLPERG